jgi:hypothetical protein
MRRADVGPPVQPASPPSSSHVTPSELASRGVPHTKRTAIAAWWRHDNGFRARGRPRTEPSLSTAIPSGIRQRRRQRQRQQSASGSGTVTVSGHGPRSRWRSRTSAPGGHQGHATTPHPRQEEPAPRGAGSLISKMTTATPTAGRSRECRGWWAASRARQWRSRESRSDAR